jgi:hypothetical protein
MLGVTIPAWAYFVYLNSFYEDSGRNRAFAIAATVLTAGIALVPVAQSFARRHNPPATEWTVVESALIALTGSGAIINIMVNGRDDVEGLETIFAIAITATTGAAIIALTQVYTRPSAAGVHERQSAEAVMKHARKLLASGETADSADERAAHASIGRQGIAAGFRQYGDANESSSRIFLFAGVLLFGGSVAAALWLVSRLGDEADVASILTRAAITVPGAVVFAVFVRESAARRRYAAWGGLIAIQAEHLGSFIADMSPEDKGELEMQFGRAVFRGGDVALERNSQSFSLTRKEEPVERDIGDATLLPASLITEILGVVTAAAEAARSVEQAVEAEALVRKAQSGVRD